MITRDKRSQPRSDINLIVNFRHRSDRSDYALGITNNFSRDGICLESSRLSVNPGEPLDLVVEHPRSHLSFTASGSVVWQKEGWYKSTAGVRFTSLNMSSGHHVQDLLASVRSASLYAPFFKQGSTEPADDNDTGSNEGTIQNEESAPANTRSALTCGVPSTPVHVSSSPERTQIRPEEAFIKNKTGRTPYLYSVTILLVMLATVIYPLTIEDVYRGNRHDQAVVSQVTAQMKASASNPAEKNVEPLSDPEGLTVKQGISATDRTAPLDLPPSDFRDITFELNSDELGSGFLPLLDELALTLTGNTHLRASIEGHADSKGPEVYNLDLALRRALAVKKYLHASGVEKHRLRISVYGDALPLAPNSTREGRMKNRRVRVLLYGDNLS